MEHISGTKVNRFFLSFAAVIARRISCVAIVFILPQFLYSQIDTTLRDYFPIQIGNYWEYLISQAPPEQSYSYCVEVAGDTIMPNGKQYRVLHGRDLYPDQNEFVPDYYRLDDSLQVFRYNGSQTCPDGEELFYKLAVHDSTIWTGCNTTPYHLRDLQFTFMDWYPGLSVSLSTKSFSSAFIDTVTGDTEYYPIGGAVYRLAKGFGLVKVLVDVVPPAELIGAIINGVKFGYITPVSVDGKDVSSVPERSIEAYPNPFNPSTTIHIELPRQSHVLLKVYDVLGRELALLLDERKPAGTYQVMFNASQLSSGIYFYRLQAGDFVQTKKMILMK